MVMTIVMLLVMMMMMIMMIMMNTLHKMTMPMQILKIMLFNFVKMTC